MTMHTLHPSIHEHGLADDCPRCFELARHPTRLLDRGMLLSLERRMTAWHSGDQRCAPRSVAEETAMNAFWQAAYVQPLNDAFSLPGDNTDDHKEVEQMAQVTREHHVSAAEQEANFQNATLQQHLTEDGWVDFSIAVYLNNPPQDALLSKQHLSEYIVEALRVLPESFSAHVQVSDATPLEEDV